MSDPKPKRNLQPDPAATKAKWPYFGRAQKLIVFAGVGIWLGLAMPWFIFRPLGITRYASPLAASWVLWAGLMTIAGAIARWRLLAVLSAVGGAGTAFVFAFWQMLRVFQVCGFDVRLRCVPGPGVFAVQAAAAFALYQAYRMFRTAR
ncbi:MAG: hypothetical protein ACRDY7_09110 [Acidimicrobiia bacterium]